MKLEFKDDVQTLTIAEVVGALVDGGDISLDDGEFVSDTHLEGGRLLVFTEIDDPHDERASYPHRDYSFDIMDLRDLFDNGDYVEWAKDEDGNTVLAGFGFC